jgi:predicted GIY-YIG superfamily endonuclease
MGQQISNWEGKSGEIYSFNVYPINSSFNEVECVYLYTKPVDTLWQCIYVGQTEHLATRLNEHENGDEDSDKCIRRSGATHIHVHRESSKSTRIDIETDLRSKYRWSCNMQ